MRLRRRFLNRLLGLPVARQNLLFAYFTATLGAEIRAAKAEGRYFEGVSDLGGSHVSKVEPEVRGCRPGPLGMPALMSLGVDPGIGGHPSRAKPLHQGAWQRCSMP